jgi:hypothetical protein
VIVRFWIGSEERLDEPLIVSPPEQILQTHHRWIRQSKGSRRTWRYLAELGTTDRPGREREPVKIKSSSDNPQNPFHIPMDLRNLDPSLVAVALAETKRWRPFI